LKKPAAQGIKTPSYWNVVFSWLSHPVLAYYAQRRNGLLRWDGGILLAVVDGGYADEWA
jgi:hypothetical protein